MCSLQSFWDENSLWRVRQENLGRRAQKWFAFFDFFPNFLSPNLDKLDAPLALGVCNAGVNVVDFDPEASFFSIPVHSMFKL